MRFPGSQLSVYKSLADYVVGCPFEFDGIYDLAPSFANTGGFKLGELDMGKLSSKTSNVLFCCGQLLDTDGSTIGYICK